MKTFIHVNQHKIRSNKLHGKDEPVITVKQGKKNTYCHEVKVNGPCHIMYSGNEKTLLPCGARVAVVTESEVEIIR